MNSKKCQRIGCLRGIERGSYCSDGCRHITESTDSAASDRIKPCECFHVTVHHSADCEDNEFSRFRKRYAKLLEERDNLLEEIKKWKSKRPFTQAEIENARMVAEAQVKTFRLDDREERISYLEERNKLLLEQIETINKCFGDGDREAFMKRYAALLEERNKELEKKK